MANIVDNLKVNKTDVKGIEIKLRTMQQFDSLKEVYYNGILVWKNANPFIFVKDFETVDLSKLSSDTLIFVNFGNEFQGSYNMIESLEEENLGVKGQMVVLETTEGDNK